MELVVAKPAIQVRWLIRSDMEEVLGIENGCFDYPWTKEDFRIALRDPKVIGMVAEIEEKIVGYMVYSLQKDRISVLNFSVATWKRHVGIGSKMVEKLICKLEQQKRSSISLEVRESNLNAQLFFKKCGFRATEILRGYYERSGEDAYRFEYRVGVNE